MTKNKIWLSSYQSGVRANIDVCASSSIVDVFQNSVRQFGTYPGFSNFGVTQTYAQTGDYVDELSAFLQQQIGLKKGDRVAIMMPNVLQYPISVFAILQAGGIIVNVNPMYTPRELVHQLNDSGAKTIIVLENFAHTLQKALPDTGIEHVIVASLGDMLGPIKGRAINFMLRHVKKMVPAYHLPHAITFKQALTIGKQQQFMPVPLALNDLAFLQYTGGTTGVPKAAELTHGNIVANMEQAGEWIKSELKEGQEVVVSPLPLYHIFSLTVNIMIFTKVGAKNILITNPRDIPALIKTLKNNRISVMGGVNTLFNALLHHPDFSQVDFSSWKLTLGGGMALQQSVADEWQKVTHIPITEAYGMTETSPGVCANPLNIKQHSGTAGLPLSNTDVEIRDEAGHVVDVGQAGELWVKGPQVMRGYWNKPEETAKVMDERGYFATGDIGKMDERGFIQLVDRKKDMIVVSGFNVYPNEVEEVITMMPQVLEVGCIGVPSEKTGEAIKIFVVKKDPTLTREQIIAFAREYLTAYKVPKNIEFRDELPKSNVGKILRKELQ